MIYRFDDLRGLFQPDCFCDILIKKNWVAIVLKKFMESLPATQSWDLLIRVTLIKG